MINVIKTSISFLVAMANKGIAGMTEYAAEYPLPYATPQDLPEKLADLNATNAVYQTALTQRKAKRVALENAVKVARLYILLVRDSLKPVFGNKCQHGRAQQGEPLLDDNGKRPCRRRPIRM